MNESKKVSTGEAIKRTRCWLETLVVELNLCPFAARPVQEGTVRYAVSKARAREPLVQDFLRELDLLQSSSEEDIATTLLIIPNMLGDFDDFMDFVGLCETLIEEAGLEAEVQLAHFHPHYLFEGEPAEGVSHYTNRAPFPTIHLIRSAQMERVLANYPDPEAIPARNIECLRELGEEGIAKLVRACEGRTEDGGSL